MKTNYLILLLLCLTSCTTQQNQTDRQSRVSIEQHIRRLSQKLAQAEATDNLATLMEHYDVHAISMPEYQLTLDGKTEIETYYTEILNRQNVKLAETRSEEFIHLDTATIVEIGTFQKNFKSVYDSLTTLKGKYWHVWLLDSRGELKLKGEAFGYFHPVETPADLVVEMSKKQPDESAMVLQKEIPFELKAYNALMEKGVRTRDATLRASFFTDDGSFFPFADTTVTGMDQIKPYLAAYSSRGKVSIDSIMCYTYHFEKFDRYILEYDMFKVKWSMPDDSGRTEGKGIRIWQRQKDHSLRLFREIGTHNHIQ